MRSGDRIAELNRQKPWFGWTSDNPAPPWAQKIINANPKEAADYRAGKTKVMGFFVGQLMKQTKGRANPQLANEIFQRLLG